MAAAASAASVGDIVNELFEFKKNQLKKKKKLNKKYFVNDQTQLNDFVNAKDIGCSRLHFLAKQVRLIKSSCSRNQDNDRLGFGLSRSAISVVESDGETKVPKTLFYFKKDKLNGLYTASVTNVNKLEQYIKFRKSYCEKVGGSPVTGSSAPVNPTVRVTTTHNLDRR